MLCFQGKKNHNIYFKAFKLIMVLCTTATKLSSLKWQDLREIAFLPRRCTSVGRDGSIPSEASLLEAQKYPLLCQCHTDIQDILQVLYVCVGGGGSRSKDHPFSQYSPRIRVWKYVWSGVDTFHFYPTVLHPAARTVGLTFPEDLQGFLKIPSDLNCLSYKDLVLAGKIYNFSPTCHAIFYFKQSQQQEKEKKSAYI